MSSPFVRYSLLRVLAFAACLFVLSLIPPLRENVLVLVLVAATVSMLLSLFLLNGPRDELSERIARRIEERHLRGHDPEQTDGPRRFGRRGSRRDTAEAEEDAEVAGEDERYR